MARKLDIRICSDIDYDHLVAEIYFNGRFVALISQEEGEPGLKVEFPGPETRRREVVRQIDLDWFQEAVERAKRKLIDGEDPE